MYSYTPEYEYPPYTSWMGTTLTILTLFIMGFYVTFTLVDYVTEEPELVQRGTTTVPQLADVLTFPIPDCLCLSVEYRDVNGTARHVYASNDDAYFRYEFNHVTVRNQVEDTVVPLPVVDRMETDNDVMLCLDDAIAAARSEMSNYALQGQFSSDVYQYVELAVGNCRGPNCVSDPTINAAIDDWVKVQILVGQEIFDTAVYHAVRTRRFDRDKRGVQRGTDVARRKYLVRGATLKHEVYMRGRQIQHEKEHWGSPPVPETTTNLLSFDWIDTLLAPRDAWTDRKIEFFVRLSPEVSQEETEYWMPSLLDLFGLWGALAAFLTELSLGFVGRRWNRFLARRSFHKRVDSFRLKHRAAAKWRNEYSAVGGILERGNEDGRTIPDLRLFDANHFDAHGRLDVSPEEFRIPTSVYGELRAYAVEQHERKYRAASRLSAWFRSKSAAKLTDATPTCTSTPSTSTKRWSLFGSSNRRPASYVTTSTTTTTRSGTPSLRPLPIRSHRPFLGMGGLLEGEAAASVPGSSDSFHQDS